MSSQTVISVENVGKSYQISHQVERQRYVALRDVVANKFKGLIKGHPHLDKSPSREDFWALKNIDFEVKQGEVLGIIGRNGAGKSTLLKILSRITEPSEGRVRIKGRIASLLEVGTGFHPELTGRENIFLNGAILGMSRAEIKSKFDEIVAFAEVEKFLDTPVKFYSSGMYVRLAFAVAAHLEPEILIVDEVLAVGDAEFQKKCLGKMQEVSQGQGRTVLFVSHNIGAVQTLCGTGLFLQNGSLKRAGEITEVANEYSASLKRNNPGGGYGRLGPIIQLEKIEFNPSPAQSGGPMSIHIQLLSEGRTDVRHFAILIYSDRAVRVAVLDLRSAGFRGLQMKGEKLALDIEIKFLPLVEGDYRLGIYLVTDDHQGDHLDLASFSVAARAPKAGVTPYPPQHRGFAEIDFSLQTKEQAQENGSSYTNPPD